MCDPISVGIAMGGASLLQGVASYQQQSAQEKMTRQQAKLQDAQAADAVRRGVIEEDRYRLKLNQAQGAARARAGGSGIVSSTGSALDILAENAAQGELDALTIRNNAARQAWGFRNDASLLRGQARMQRQAARNTLLLAPISAGTSGLSGYSGAGGTFK